MVNRTNLIVLAAGRGSRIGPHYSKIPKCQIEINGIRIIDYLLETIQTYEFDRKLIITGYFENELRSLGLETVHNPNHQTTTMVESLWCARAHLEEDFVIVYADIIIPKSLFSDIMAAEPGITVGVDPNWFTSWSLRYQDPFVDAESLKISNNRITQLGGRANSQDDISAHYIGIIKVSGKLREVFVRQLDSQFNREQSMSEFLGHLAQKGIPLVPVFCHEPWAEVDTVSDMAYASKVIKKGVH